MLSHSVEKVTKRKQLEVGSKKGGAQRKVRRAERGPLEALGRAHSMYIERIMKTHSAEMLPKWGGGISLKYRRGGALLKFGIFGGMQLEGPWRRMQMARVVQQPAAEVLATPRFRRWLSRWNFLLVGLGAMLGWQTDWERLRAWSWGERGHCSKESMSAASSLWEFQGKNRSPMTGHRTTWLECQFYSQFGGSGCYGISRAINLKNQELLRCSCKTSWLLVESGPLAFQSCREAGIILGLVRCL